MEKILAIAAMTLLIAVASAIVFGGIFFGFTGLFSILGVNYKSTGSLLLFILYCFLVGTVFEIMEQIILFLIGNANKLFIQEKWVLIALVRLGLTWLIIPIAGDMMTTVVLSNVAEFITALLMVCIDIVGDDEIAAGRF